MLNSPVLDIVIGLVFIFLIYSLLATAIREAIATLLGHRANMLYKGIECMLTNTDLEKATFSKWLNNRKENFREFATQISGWFRQRKKPEKLHEKFYAHPIIKNYGQNIFFSKPSYISSQNFSEVLTQTLAEVSGKVFDSGFGLEDVQNGIKNSSVPAEAQKILQYHLNEAAGDLNVFKARLEQWYKESMDRVTGWYKRNTQFWLLSIGLVLAVTMNIDAIEITKILSKDKKAREQLVLMAQAYSEKTPAFPLDSIITKEQLKAIQDEADGVNTLLGLGWNDYGRKDSTYCNKLATTNCKPRWWEWGGLILYCSVSDMKLVEKEPVFKKIEHYNKLMEDYPTGVKLWYIWFHSSKHKVIGFFITAMAIGLGAPFWFDLLNKLVKLRTAGKSTNGESERKPSSENEIDG